MDSERYTPLMEAAARRLCLDRGADPDTPTRYTAPRNVNGNWVRLVAMFRPLWMQACEEIEDFERLRRAAEIMFPAPHQNA